MTNGDHDLGVRTESRTFFRKMLSDHDKVTNVEEKVLYEFTIERTTGPTVKATLTGEYAVGMEWLMEFLEAHPKSNCVVLASVWQRYSLDAKEMATEKKIGLFTMKELMGALNIEKFWEYQPKKSKE